MKRNSFIIILDCVLAALFLAGIIYMYEVRSSAADAADTNAVSNEILSNSDSSNGSTGSIQSLSLLFARTDAQRDLGLGERASLPADEGMLFVFDAPGEYGFWMKDMSFPIDMIWLDADFRVVYIAADVSPATYPEVFSPPAPSLYVLETNAGYAQENNLFAGEPLDFIQNKLGTQ